MKRISNLTMNFLFAAPWPLLLAACSCATALLLGDAALGRHAQGNHLAATFFAFPTLGWLALGFIALLDAIARHLDYRRIRRMLERYGFHERVFRVVASSRCQRDAALLAARRTGHLPQARRFFRQLGYRWYHLLPDKVADNPFHFFNPDFLRQAFLPSRNR
ncbi:hypothetical protein [Paucidesulfovibrio longus]|uniref:hypothetical protein n=1 Tax=Paucidesulfovibrio longus TaxID=889 RepID=UPI0003B7726D|nr:hypothetical protein [Paucidesulfovibrio longus]